METANQRHAQAPAPASPARKNNRFIRRPLWSAALLIMGLLGVLLVGYLALSLGTAPVLTGMVMAAIPVPLYLALALWLDRYENEPARMLACAPAADRDDAGDFAVLSRRPDSVSQARFAVKVGRAHDKRSE